MKNKILKSNTYDSNNARKTPKVVSNRTSIRNISGMKGIVDEKKASFLGDIFKVEDMTYSENEEIVYESGSDERIEDTNQKKGGMLGIIKLGSIEEERTSQRGPSRFFSKSRPEN